MTCSQITSFSDDMLSDNLISANLTFQMTCTQIASISDDLLSDNQLFR
jgi:hypothetical protein